jgi:hypothetical protein
MNDVLGELPVLDCRPYHHTMTSIFDVTMPTAMSQVLDQALAWIYSFQPLLEPTVILGTFKIARRRRLRHSLLTPQQQSPRFYAMWCNNYPRPLILMSPLST